MNNKNNILNNFCPTTCPNYTSCDIQNTIDKCPEQKLLLSTIRRAYPKLIAEELNSVQPMPDLPVDIFKSQTVILNCSCGTTLLKLEGFFSNVEAICGCGKKWEFIPVCELTKLTWMWREKHE
jgi:hypothetical protein